MRARSYVTHQQCVKRSQAHRRICGKLWVERPNPPPLQGGRGADAATPRLKPWANIRRPSGAERGDQREPAGVLVHCHCSAGRVSHWRGYRVRGLRRAVLPHAHPEEAGLYTLPCTARAACPLLLVAAYGRARPFCG